RRPSGRNVIERSHAAEQPVHDADPRLRGGHERARLRHQYDQGDLPQVRRLPRHVWAGQDDDLLARGGKPYVVRYERAGPERPLALVVLRHVPGASLGDLYVVAEDAIVAHLQRLYARALSLADFQLSEGLTGIPGGRPQGVELAGEARSNRPLLLRVLLDRG